MTVKIDDKGRITIPKKIREKMELKKGTKLKIVAKKDEIIPDGIDEFLDTVIKKRLEKVLSVF